MEYTKEALEKLIVDCIEETAHLDYKAADSLSRTDGKKREITKDISAFANSAGGMIIYGMREHTDPAKAHLPERLDPVNQREYSKEWLDQISSSIQPRIEGLKISPIHIGPETSDFCYVVEIPQSATAHQALDLSTYKRRNFESTAMEDYEIRDVMNRRKHPVITAAIRIVSHWPRGNSHIAVRFHNTSRVIARHFAAVVHLPLRLTSGALLNPEGGTIQTKDGQSLWLIPFSNDINSPLFPESMTVLSKGFDLAHNVVPEPGPSISNIRITLYADEMEKIDLVKELAVAEREWT